ncbi:hypothetical protein BDQ17DRAFT_1256941, partial [Cyathus striatus]
LNVCLCSEVVDNSLDTVVNCNQAGCETEWYHLECISERPLPCNWICNACQVTDMGGSLRGSKRARK